MSPRNPVHPRKPPLVPGDGDPRHGTNGYTNLGCRCEVCRAANTANNLRTREDRKRRLEQDPSIRPHGVETTYLNYGCRCVPCTDAKRAADARRAKERSA